MLDSTVLVAFASAFLAVAAVTIALVVLAALTLVREHRAANAPRVVTVTRQSQVDLQRAA